VHATRSPATRAWLEEKYGVKTQEPGEWVQAITIVYDGVDKLVLEGDRRVFVNEPASGQKLEIGYFKDKTTVGSAFVCRPKLPMFCVHSRPPRATGTLALTERTGDSLAHAYAAHVRMHVHMRMCE
jgi:hypothetical protein